MGTTVGPAQVRAFRWSAQQLDRVHGSLDDTAVLDVGVQDTGPDGARWALALRGVDLGTSRPDALVTLWTVRGAPHLYRRADPPHVAAAAQPYSDADAGKRLHDASPPLGAAGIANLEALDAVAEALRSVVTAPMVKGEVSGALTARLPPPYLRDCRPCGATHVHEMPFRLAALRAGLELVPDTSPPVLQPLLVRAGGRAGRAVRPGPGLPAAARPDQPEPRRGLPGRAGQGRQGALARRRLPGAARRSGPARPGCRRRPARRPVTAVGGPARAVRPVPAGP